MPQVSTDQFQVVVDGRRRNLKIRIRKRLSGLLQLRGEQSAHLCDGHIIWEYSHSRQNTLSNIGEMAVPHRRTIGSSIQFPDNHSTCKLAFSGNAP